MTNYIAALVDELYQLGIREVVISPGARSTPLAFLFCEHDFKTFINIDERSAGFFALGIAKEFERPVVLVCTSGSAVANYLPAIIEAKYSGVPLIILSADRPHELRQVGAPQTIDQNKILRDYVEYYEELALPEENKKMYRYVRVVMQKAYSSTIAKSYGVAHINVPLREPLIPNINRLDFTLDRQSNRFEYLKGEEDMNFDDSILDHKKGMIICGPDAYSKYYKDVIRLAQRLNAPLLADPLSNIRNFESHVIVDSYDAFLRNEDIKMELKPQYIIHFGSVPVSKRLQQFLSLHNDVIYIQVNNTFEYRNSSLSTTKYIQATPKLFINKINVQNNNTEYLDKWRMYNSDMRNKLSSAINEDKLFEGKIINILQDMLLHDTRLVVSNSMAIRDMDYFFASRNQNIKVLCNRGANGIEGTVSTALGVSTCNKPTVLITGDLSFYHDLNGLLVGKTHDLNLTIILLNNNGGGIFRYLPQSKEKHFEYLFLTPHGINFEGVRSLYNLNYYSVNDYKAFVQVLKETMDTEGIKLIDIKLDSIQSKSLHDYYTC